MHLLDAGLQADRSRGGWRRPRSCASTRASPRQRLTPCPTCVRFGAAIGVEILQRLAGPEQLFELARQPAHAAEHDEFFEDDRPGPHRGQNQSDDHQFDDDMRLLKEIQKRQVRLGRGQRLVGDLGACLYLVQQGQDRHVAERYVETCGCEQAGIHRPVLVYFSRGSLRVCRHSWLLGWRSPFVCWPGAKGAVVLVTSSLSQRCPAGKWAASLRDLARLVQSRAVRRRICPACPSSSHHDTEPIWSNQHNNHECRQTLIQPMRLQYDDAPLQEVSSLASCIRKPLIPRSAYEVINYVQTWAQDRSVRPLPFFITSRQS